MRGSGRSACFGHEGTGKEGMALIRGNGNGTASVVPVDCEENKREPDNGAAVETWKKESQGLDGRSQGRGDDATGGSMSGKSEKSSDERGEGTEDNVEMLDVNASRETDAPGQNYPGQRQEKASQGGEKSGGQCSVDDPDMLDIEP